MKNACWVNVYRFPLMVPCHFKALSHVCLCLNDYPVRKEGTCFLMAKRSLKDLFKNAHFWAPHWTFSSSRFGVWPLNLNFNSTWWVGGLAFEKCRLLPNRVGGYAQCWILIFERVRTTSHSYWHPFQCLAQSFAHILWTSVCRILVVREMVIEVASEQGLFKWMGLQETRSGVQGVPEGRNNKSKVMNMGFPRYWRDIYYLVGA